MTYCKDRCNRIYPNKIYGLSGKFRGWVEEGFKQCSKCEFIVKTEDRNCKCCGVYFRTRKKCRYSINSNNSKKNEKMIITTTTILTIQKKMVCDDCIKAQADLSNIKYIRIQDNTTDIMIVACQKHLSMIQNTNLELKYESIEEVRQNSIKDATRK